MLFDLDCRGHHASYIQYLIIHWHNHDLSGSLDIVVTNKFVEQYPILVELTNSTKSNIKFIPITSEEEKKLKTVYSALDRFQRSFQEWQLIDKYTKITGCDHCLIMFFDSLLWRMSFRIKPSCSMSGIFFRPISHYRNFPNFRPSSRERFWEFREKMGLSRMLALGCMENFFCLDPLAAKYYSQLYSETNITYLPDPVKTYNISQEQTDKLELNLEIEAGRKIFLLFGSLTDRKGVYQLLEAIKTLSPELSQQLCLLIIGPVEENKNKIDMLVKETTEFKPVQIICRDEYVMDREIQPYFKISDVILAPYQRHVGMSSILVRAATASKPVLASDYGLMGQVTSSNKLGITVNSEFPQGIADGLALCLSEPADNLCNHEKMREFAEQNKAEQFSQVILSRITSQTYAMIER